jgi:hypothetical protein
MVRWVLVLPMTTISPRHGTVLARAERKHRVNTSSTLRRALIVATATVGVTLIVAANAGAYYIDGKNPYSTGCSADAVVATKSNGQLANTYIYGDNNGAQLALLDNMWSQTCLANYAWVYDPGDAFDLRATAKRLSDNTTADTLGIKKGSTASQLLYGNGIVVCAVGGVWYEGMWNNAIACA